ncbi:extracellular solute-binding protein [Paenibacillus spongiae]|uniref:Extracellular solute-binding protein n=1 Tax=Paenibacillus spongiae TaxID=2909671 RepID=A0ABY5S3V0_9BACL|nr:extracellular solute-binding protein [Paenibacillus spongiae]UVI27520.1 extracellular solute-binding protein [Paenibacillus spongiae]
MLKRVHSTVVLTLSLCMILFLLGPVKPTSGETTSSSLSEEYSSDDATTYQNVIKPFTERYIEGSAITLPGGSYSALSDPALFARDGEEVLAWNSEQGWVEWKISIPEDGLYEIGLTYDSNSDAAVGIVRGVQIDGAFPFKEAERLHLKRQFSHDPYPPQKDEFGNDRRPQSVEIKGWKTEPFTNYDVETGPLRWPLTKGEHTLRLVGEYQPIKIKQLYIVPSASPVSYADVKQNDGEQSGDWISIIEAENISRKSDTSIQLQSSDAPRISPETKGLIRFNSLGGEQFRQSGQWAEWDFEVPADGTYQIGFKYLQTYLNNSYAYRTVTIDGEPPFAELEKVAFPYDTEWHNMTLSDKEDKPLNLYLTKGKHTLRMTATAAPIKPVYDGILRNMNRLSELEAAIRKVTGNFDKSLTENGNIDLNRDWELEKYIPDLSDRFDAIIDDLTSLSDHLQTLSSGGKSDVENALRTAAEDLGDMRDKPRDIPNELGQFSKMQSSLSNWLFRMLDQPVMFDYLYIAQPGADIPRATPGFFESFGHSVTSFFRTFTIDYDFRRNAPGGIDIWVNRGRDYVNLIQQLADETFTPETGITVNVNIVPDPQMFILGNAAGIQPDVALGIDSAMPADFAMRGALLDLSTFPDYEEVAQSFHPGALRVFHYDEGDYALPEIQGFNVMAYRTDILESLGLTPPDTWEEMYKMLSTLQQNGYDFYLPPKDYNTFLFQNGAELYTPNGMKSALDSEKAYKGFRQLTEMFTLYQLPRDVPSFFNHFRLGDMPVGIIDFNSYLQTEFAAPELAGKWAIAPLPGIRNEEGVVERWSGGPMQAGVIFKKTENKDKAWQFLKWWTSDLTQERFGNDIEAVFGPEYRWNTANMNAFARLPWPQDDLEVIKEQHRWFREAPQVPGGYFTGRQLEFAWNKAVIEKKNVREALEQAFIDTNREMSRKQIEFGLREKHGKILRELDIPAVTKPWEGEGSR